MSHEINIDTAKEIATYIKKRVLSPRGFFVIQNESGGVQPAYAPLSAHVNEFVAKFKLSPYADLHSQYIAAFVARGFNEVHVSDAYDEACEKFRVDTGLPGAKRSEREAPEWPAGFYSGSLCEVHLLDGVESVRIGRWIGATANVVDESGKHVGILVRHLSEHGKWIEHVIELDHLSSDGSQMFQALEESGYRLSGDRKARGALRRLLLESEADIGLRTVVRYSRPGWHGDTFVLPTGAAVSNDGVNNAFVASGVSAEVGGTYEQWCEHVRDEIWQGDTPQYAVGMLAGLAGIISSRLACDHPVIYFTGPMGSGKTTSQVIGAGTVASPNEGEGTLFGVSDDIDIARGAGTSVHIDDPTKRPSLASAKKIESLIYSLYERTAATISSVSTLERLIEKAKGTMSDGVRRRVLTIDTTGIAPIEIGRAMAIKSAAKRYYGHAATIFARQIGSVDDLHDRVRECTKAFVGDTKDPELYGIGWIAGILLAAAQIGELSDVVPEGGAEQIFPFLKEAVDDWSARRRIGSGLAVIEGLVSEARPLGECQEGAVWLGQDRDGDGAGRVLYVRTDRLDRGQVRQIKAVGKLVELNDNNVAHNYLPQPDGRFLRHYRVRAMIHAAG